MALCDGVEIIKGDGGILGTGHVPLVHVQKHGVWSMDHGPWTMEASDLRTSANGDTLLPFIKALSDMTF
jgi:hypothetical protein